MLDDRSVIRLSCPTGCRGAVPVPFARRAEAVRCHNCTAWFRAPDRMEDESYAVADLVARPGEPPARSRPALRWRWLAAGALWSGAAALATQSAWAAGAVALAAAAAVTLPRR